MERCRQGVKGKNMKQNGNYYVADEGKTFIRRADSYDMGEEMWLGEDDSIDNYREE